MSTVDLPGLLRRVRREADMSQRELAAALGISQARVAAAECGRGDWQVALLARAAALAGFRLVLVDGSGRAARPMAADSARDRAGRRMPAHLDTRHGDVEWWHGQERYSRERPEWTFDRIRETRDRVRDRTGTPADHDRPGPGDSLAERAAARRREGLDRARAAAAEHRRLNPPSADDPVLCTCPPGCDDLLLADLPDRDPERAGRRRPLHVPECPCGCDLG